MSFISALNLNAAEKVAVSIFLFSFAIQLLYWLRIYIRIIFTASESKDSPEEEDPPVSVVICARNEASNLKKHLPEILEQDYHCYEVIVVNDSSEDETENILDELKKKSPRLRSTRTGRDPRFTHGKKLALTLGLKAAKNEWVLLTDADCRPVGRNWIKEMAKHFTGDKNLVLGYGKYKPEKKFLNRLIRMDTMFIGMQYLTFAMAGLPYMGVGRNLAYRRSLFFNNNGFATHLKIKSGDDDLFVNEVATAGNTAVELSPASHTESVPSATFGEWIAQKKRHLSTGLHYRRMTKILLGGEIFSRLLFYLSFIFLLIKSTIPLIVLSVFVLRLLIQLLIFKFASIRLNEKKLLLISPVYDIFIPFINLALSTANYICTKRNKWK